MAAGSNAKDKKFEREFRRRWGWLLNAAKLPEALLRRAAHEPSTVLRRLKQRAQRSFDRRIALIGADQLLDDMLMTWLPDELWESVVQEMPAKLDERELELSGSDIGSALLGLVRSAERSIAGSSLVLLGESADEQTLHASAALADLAEMSGEHQLRSAIRVVSDVAEQLYKPYLKRLWLLANVRDSTPTKQCPPRLGVLQRELSKRVAPCLLNELVVRVRNAADHDETTYEVDSNTMKLTNTNDQRRVVWSDTVDVDALVDCAEFVQTAVTMLQEIAVQVMLRRMHEFGVWDSYRLFLRALREKDESLMAAHGPVVGARMEAVFEPIGSLIQQGYFMPPATAQPPSEAPPP